MNTIYIPSNELNKLVIIYCNYRQTNGNTVKPMDGQNGDRRCLNLFFLSL